SGLESRLTEMSNFTGSLHLHQNVRAFFFAIFVYFFISKTFYIHNFLYSKSRHSAYTPDYG
ncbi:hypothetical protein AB6D12_16925, partial [Vibrio cyclitrophicus]